MQGRPPIPQYPRPLKRSRLYFVLALLLFGCAIIASVFVWLKSEIQSSGFSSDPSSRQFVIGNDVVTLPLNLMRFQRQREAAALEQADLLILWPDGSGYSETNADRFLSEQTSDDLIFITLAKRNSQYDMDGRLEPIYMKLFDGPSTIGPSGLRLQKLVSGSGYDGELLAIYPGSSSIWTSRCQTEQENIRTTCLRDVFIGKELSLRYRFSTKLLKNWREIDALVLKTVVPGLKN